MDLEVPFFIMKYIFPELETREGVLDHFRVRSKLHVLKWSILLHGWPSRYSVEVTRFSVDNKPALI